MRRLVRTLPIGLYWITVGILLDWISATGSAALGVKENEAVTSTGEPVLAAPWTAAPYVLPSFDNATARNVTTQLGQTAYLHCIVRNLGDKTVSWVRRKVFDVLTVGLEVYTSDARFQPVHVEHTNDWALQIRYVEPKDAGIYECQISSDPKISYFVNLTVLVAKTHIDQGPDWYVNTGSSLNLTCVIAQSPEPPVFVFWYHDNRMINYDSSRSEITIQKFGQDTSISKLYIRDVQSRDSGNYTCCPSNAEAASITVHVLNGEKPAAMQHDGSSTISTAPSQHLSKILFLVLVSFMVLR